LGENLEVSQFKVRLGHSFFFATELKIPLKTLSIYEIKLDGDR
jgi:hypothetical protein